MNNNQLTMELHWESLIHRSLNSFSLSFLSHVKNCNHKGLGIYYLLSAFIFGISGTLISVLLRIELYSSGNRIISPENQNFYNISITLHGFIMIFFLVMPSLFGGFGNYFVPIFQGSPEVVYPRVNNFSILILFVSYLFFILSLISEFGGGTGWTFYPPLSTSFLSLSPSSTGNLIFGLLISGVSSCLTSLNFQTTILNLRSYYLTLKTMPLFLWALLITGGMLLLTLPILSGAFLMVLADLHSNTLFFDPIFGGDPIFYQHLFLDLSLLLIGKSSSKQKTARKSLFIKQYRLPDRLELVNSCILLEGSLGHNLISRNSVLSSEVYQFVISHPRKVVMHVIYGYDLWRLGNFMRENNSL